QIERAEHAHFDEMHQRIAHRKAFVPAALDADRIDAAGAYAADGVDAVVGGAGWPVKLNAVDGQVGAGGDDGRLAVTLRYRQERVAKDRPRRADALNREVVLVHDAGFVDVCITAVDFDGVSIARRGDGGAPLRIT